MRKVNTDGLKKAARAKSDACLSRSLSAIDALKKEMKPVTFSSVMEKAHVSRAFLYGNKYLREMIEKARSKPEPNTSSQQMLMIAQEIEIKRLLREVERLRKYEDQANRLQKENSELKEQLKIAYQY